MADAVAVDPAPAKVTRLHLLRPWIYTSYQAILPILVSAAAAVVFLRLAQAREALFGTIGMVLTGLRPGHSIASEVIGSQFLALTVVIAVFALVCWYTARLLVTVDAGRNLPPGAQRLLGQRAIRNAAEHLPRLLGGVTAAALIAALLNALAIRGAASRWLPAYVVAAAFSPLAAGLAIQFLARRGWRRLAWMVAGAALPWLAVLGAPPAQLNWAVLTCLAALCYLPALLYAATVQRRTVLRALGMRAGHPAAPLDFGLALGRLTSMAAAGTLLLALLGTGPVSLARATGASAIVLVFLTGLLSPLCAATLVLRRISRRAPGVVTIVALGALSLYLVLHAALGWDPFKERVGMERIAAIAPAGMPRATQPAGAQDVVVNAYGGGLRAGLFTAQVLADLDDRSCGEFGRRLHRLSGVSGGSLGIAVYLTLRQELVASGGWGRCRPALGNPRLLRTMVESVLAQDHLSAAMARMLSIDLIPGATPQRGQALLDSWQNALNAELSGLRRQPGRAAVSLAGLALPLHMLSGGVTPAPGVYFNTTDTRSGQRVWFSNGGRWQDDGGVQNTLTDAFQVGQAVLHSARFPLVSPAGAVELSAQQRVVVDGGYADNSGAGTLLDGGSDDHNMVWLSLDGNPPPACNAPSADANDQVWTPVGALLAVRRRQANLAVLRFRDAHKDAIYTPLSLDLYAAFKDTIPDDEKRCTFVRGLRSAPLGWYMTRVTVGDQNIAIVAAVEAACKKLQPLCDSP
ncbi:MAG: hypothetical protein QFF03_12010 [Pseudomonadota bacterium]|nr:hypothetical protein [Pseudomonadota bacterium]